MSEAPHYWSNFKPLDTYICPVLYRKTQFTAHPFLSWRNFCDRPCFILFQSHNLFMNNLFPIWITQSLLNVCWNLNIIQPWCKVSIGWSETWYDIKFLIGCWVHVWVPFLKAICSSWSVSSDPSCFSSFSLPVLVHWIRSDSWPRTRCVKFSISPWSCFFFRSFLVVGRGLGSSRKGY